MTKIVDERLRIMVVNGQAASASDAHTRKVVAKTFKEASAAGVDVIGWCEVGDVEVLPLGQAVDENWFTHQFGLPGKDQPQSGLAASWMDTEATLLNFSRTVGSPATSEGRWKTGAGIRERSILSAILKTTYWQAHFNVIHPPPLRAPKARISYIKRALKKAGIIVGDTNFLHRMLVRLDPRRKIVSVGLLAIFVPRRFWVSAPVKVDVGSDHLAFYVTIEPKRARKKRLAKKK